MIALAIVASLMTLATILTLAYVIWVLTGPDEKLTDGPQDDGTIVALPRRYRFHVVDDANVPEFDWPDVA